jgi:hypothetical protein
MNPLTPKMVCQAKKQDTHTLEDPNLARPSTKVGLSEMINEYEQMVVFLVILRPFDQT